MIFATVNSIPARVVRSPSEFLSATSRLAHLNLEGFERFVGNTFDRALQGSRTGKTYEHKTGLMFCFW